MSTKGTDYTSELSHVSSLTHFAKIFAELTGFEYFFLSLSHNDYMASELAHLAGIPLVDCREIRLAGKSLGMRIFMLSK